MRRAGKLGWGLADQALSSATNFAYAVIVAREVGAAEFGAFGLGYAVYVLLGGVVRTWTSEPLAVVFSGAEGPTRRRAIAESLGAGVGLGLAGGGVVAVIGLALGGHAADALVPIGILLSGLVLQDMARFAFSVEGQPRRAFVNDLTWLVLLAVASAGLLATDRATLVTLTVAWALSGAVCGGLAILQGLPAPVPRRGIAWLTQQRSIGARYGAEFLATVGAWQAVLFGAGAVAGLSAVAALRGAQVLYGPLHVANRATLLVVVPEGIRSTARDPDRVVAAARRMTLVLGGIGLLWTVGVVLLPGSLGEQLLGDSWGQVDDVRLPFGVFMAFFSAITGSAVALRILGDPRPSLRAAAWAAPIQIVAGLVGAVVDGGRGCAVGLAGAGALCMMIWWRATVTAARRQPRTLQGAQP